MSDVLEDASCQGMVAGVRALGILDKFITGPLWRKINQAESMQQRLQQLTSDSSPLLDGTFRLFEDIEINMDCVYDSLLRPDVSDATAQTALEALMHALLLILERQAEYQLGGKYNSPNQTLKNSAANVPTTNVTSERDFGSLDLLLRMKWRSYCKRLSLFGH